MKFHKFAAFCLLVIFSMKATSENAWKLVTKIEGIQALNDDRYILYLPAGSNPICRENGRLFYVVPGQNGVTPDGAKNILSLALVAFSTGRNVSVYYNSATAYCYVQQIHLRNDG